MIGPQTERNKDGDPDADRGRRLPVRDDRQGDPGLRSAVRHVRDLRRLDREPARDRHAPRPGAWQRANPAATSRQAGTTPSGSIALVTGAKAGSTATPYDVDGGVTTIRSRRSLLPATTGSLTFRYYLAHSSNSSSADYFRAYVEDATGHRTLVKQERGAANTDLPSWSTASVSMAPWAGQTIRIVFAAADLGRASTVEAAVDDVRITRP